MLCSLPTAGGQRWTALTMYDERFAVSLQVHSRHSTVACLKLTQIQEENLDPPKHRMFPPDGIQPCIW